MVFCAVFHRKVMKLRYSPLVMVLSSTLLFAQNPSQSVPLQRSENPGHVIGHVTAGPQGLPVRGAVVQLIPVTTSEPLSVKPADFKKNPNSLNQQARQIEVAASRLKTITDLKGDYVIDPPAPGEYYVHAEMEGYVSTLQGFPANELQTPSKNVLNALAAEGHKIIVQPGKTNQADLVLTKGAALGGVVRYDDGQPAADVTLFLLKQQENGSWQPFSSMPIRTADDRGAFRFAGLFPGKYSFRINAAASRNVPLVGGGFAPGAVAGQNELSVKDRKATTYEIKPDEELTDVAITVPVSNLHRISGRVVADSNSHPFGDVLLFDSEDTNIGPRVARIDKEGTFSFQNVPEGNYILRTVVYKDTQSLRIVGAKANGELAAVLDHQYSSNMPVAVKGDIEGLLLQAKGITRSELSVPDRAKK